MFGITFHPYGLVIGLGIFAALEASVRLAKARGIDQKIIEKLFWWVVISGVIGARLYHVIDKWQTIYSLNPISVFFVWNGGLGIWGAIIGGIIALIAFIKTQKLKNSRTRNLIELLDIGTFGLPLGQAIGRWGNFFNNEIVGRNGEPLFLYESILNLVLFVILILVAKKTKRAGRVVGVYLIGYGFIRFVLEPLRPDAIVWKISGIPTAMIFSAIAIVSGTYFIWRRRD